MFLMSPKATFEYPYALPGMPTIINGSKEICNYIIKQQFISDYLFPVEYEFTDTGLLIAEINVQEIFLRTSKRYDQKLTCHVQISGSKIQHYKN